MQITVFQFISVYFLLSKPRFAMFRKTKTKLFICIFRKLCVTLQRILNIHYSFITIHCHEFIVS